MSGVSAEFKKCWIYAKYTCQSEGEGSPGKLAPCREHHFAVPLKHPIM